LSPRDLDIAARPHVIIIDGRLFGYGQTKIECVTNFRLQVSGGGALGMHLMARGVPSLIDDDHASEIEEMLAANITRWE
jgi:hypothetical protein